MIEISLGDKDHLDLCDILKMAKLCDSGGVAKHIIASGVVTVDGAIETRKRCKIRKNQVIKYDGQEVKLI